MGFMTKEEQAEFNRKNNRVDFAITKRTCATCSHKEQCTVIPYFLEKTEARECDMWAPSFKYCGNCKHLVPTGYRTKFSCNVHGEPADKEIYYDQYRCDEGNWELASDLVRYP